MEAIIQLASSGDGIFSGSCDSGQNKGRLDSAALLWTGSTGSLTKLTQSCYIAADL